MGFKDLGLIMVLGVSGLGVQVFRGLAVISSGVFRMLEVCGLAGVLGGSPWAILTSIVAPWWRPNPRLPSWHSSP